ncbi:putative chromatin remodeling & transcriptional activation CHROMO-DOMAIN family [Helianthus annuus]|nr:putative chromatin remodeling & transcriptional activation CHROMO-DOMAIN family [Helianthus annuus]
MVLLYLADETTYVPLDDIVFDERLNYVERPIAIKYSKVTRLQNKSIKQVLVQWQHWKGSDLTWELEDEMREHYPTLFGVKEESSSQAKQQGNQDRGTLLARFMVLLCFYFTIWCGNCIEHEKNHV